MQRNYKLSQNQTWWTWSTMCRGLLQKFIFSKKLLNIVTRHAMTLKSGLNGREVATRYALLLLLWLLLLWLALYSTTHNLKSLRIRSCLGTAPAGKGWFWADTTWKGSSASLVLLPGKLSLFLEGVGWINSTTGSKNAHLCSLTSTHWNITLDISVEM